jgi:hypothetical protein
MGQQPNIELSETDLPRRHLEPGPAVKWRSDKPGLPSGPADVPKGGTFGTVGPDPGWATKLVRATQLPEDDPALEAVVIALVMARAAALGRAAVPEDIEAALMVCGYYEEAPPKIISRRRRWLDAVPHDPRPGQTAVSEVDRVLLIDKPERIRWAHRLTGKS